MATAVPQKAKGSKKTRKLGRAKNRHQAHIRYTNEKRWIKNQLRQVRKHVASHPNDKRAIRYLVFLFATLSSS